MLPNSKSAEAKLSWTRKERKIEESKSLQITELIESTFLENYLLKKTSVANDNWN
jgi:hypothetical protein